MVKAVIFDFDGTIADTLPVIMEIGKQYAEEEGQDFPDHINELREKTEEELREMFNIPVHRIPFYFKRVRDDLGKRILDCHLFMGMDHVIQDLAKEYRMGLLTSNKKKYVKKFLKEHDLWKHFDAKVGGLSMRGKPGRLKKLARKLGVDVSEAIYVGDGEGDIEACKHDEMRIISVTWGFNSEPLLKRLEPDFLAYNPREIMNIVRSMDETE